MLVMDDKPQNKRRRWYQFSLRTLLLLITVGSALSGLMGLKLRQARRQQAVTAIENDGGIVKYDYQFRSYDRQSQVPTPAGPAWLRKMVGDDFFASVIYCIVRASPISGWRTCKGRPPSKCSTWVARKYPTKGWYIFEDLLGCGNCGCGTRM
jgi:hypothetical protein